MYQTPWTKSSSSTSLTSDRLRPSTPKSSKGTSGKGSSKNSAVAVKKSKAVTELENILNGLKKEKWVKDPKGGCFCQGREHKLSSYTPICYSCALILCELNLPHHLCPHCRSPLLSDHSTSASGGSNSRTPKHALITRLETQIADQLVKEEEQRIRKAEEQRRAAGEFPTLSGAGAGGPGGNQAAALSSSASGTGFPGQTYKSHSQPHLPTYHQPQAHKVISLNSKTKKVVVSSYTNTPASSAGPSSRSDTPAQGDLDMEAFVIRIPPPPKGVVYAEGAKVDPGNPWVDLSRSGGDEVVYVPLPKVKGGCGDAPDGKEGGKKEGGSSRKRRGKGKQGGGEEGGGKGKEKAVA